MARWSCCSLVLLGLIAKVWAQNIRCSLPETYPDFTYIISDTGAAYLNEYGYLRPPASDGRGGDPQLMNPDFGSPDAGGTPSRCTFVLQKANSTADSYVAQCSVETNVTEGFQAVRCATQSAAALPSRYSMDGSRIMVAPGGQSTQQLATKWLGASSGYVAPIAREDPSNGITGLRFLPSTYTPIGWQEVLLLTRDGPLARTTFLVQWLQLKHFALRNSTSGKACTYDGLKAIVCDTDEPGSIFRFERGELIDATDPARLNALCYKDGKVIVTDHPVTRMTACIPNIVVAPRSLFGAGLIPYTSTLKQQAVEGQTNTGVYVLAAVGAVAGLGLAVGAAQYYSTMQQAGGLSASLVGGGV